MQVIVAQESKAIRNVLRTVVRSTRYAEARMVDVLNAEDLLRCLQGNGDPDTLVLLDWNLPGLDVPTVLGRLGRGRLDQVSILLSVNSAQAPQAAEAVRLGASGYLTRPFSDEDLGAKIEEIGRARLNRPSTGTVIRRVPVQEELPSLLRLPSRLIARLFERTRTARYESGAEILRPGDRVASLSLITLGEVEILSSEKPSGREVRGAGECFGERAFVCGEPSKISVRAVTAVDVVAVSKESMVELARSYPAIQGFLADLLTQQRAVPEAKGELSGTTASLSFPDLLQFLNATHRTGVLVLETGGKVGRIYLERGEVTDAREGGESGEPVFRRLAGRPEARFDFRAGAIPGVRTIFQSTMQLLMSSFAGAEAAAS